MSNIPAVNEDKIMNKRLAKGKENYKGRSSDRSKVRMELICDDFNSCQCIYSNKIIGANGGPKTSDIKDLQRWSEGG